MSRYLRFTLPFCCKRFFNPNISKTIQARGLKFLCTLQKSFKKCKSFGVAYLQLRVDLHLSWAFFDILSFVNNFCEIVHFQKGGTGPPNHPPWLRRCRHYKFVLSFFGYFLFNQSKIMLFSRQRTSWRTPPLL